MLEIIRKRASSWETKVIFGIIIIVFIFFFGYSTIQKSSGPSHGVAADVNGETISYSMYQFAFDNSYQFYKQIYKGEIPAEMVKQIQLSALQQLINSKLLLQLGRSLGLRVSNKELVNAIERNPLVTRGGTFDPAQYKNSFLPFFQGRFGIDFESMLADELLTRKTESLLLSAVRVSEEEAKASFEQKNTKWTFERVELNPQALIESKKIQNGEEAPGIANETLERWKDKKDIKGPLKKYGVEVTKIGPISTNERYRLFSDVADQKDFIDVFSLTSESPVVKAPLHIGSRFYIFKLVKKDEPNKESWEKEKSNFINELQQKKQQLYMQQWLAYLSSKANIRNYLGKED